MKNRQLSIFLFLLGIISLNAQEWQTDYDLAAKEASKKNFPIILVFQGSDWCAPCIKLKRDVFQKEIFQLYAKDHFVMLEADFPRRKKNALPEEQQQKNNALAEKYNPRGIFPFVVILNSDGKVLGETGYMKTSPSQYILHLESFKG
ncbi:MAG: thioredoxin family protein [Flavobacteriaceae bacterium]|nr:thioredoxin family protein [Flavobacteriaceae bacterium]